MNFTTSSSPFPFTPLLLLPPPLPLLTSLKATILLEFTLALFVFHLEAFYMLLYLSTQL